ncbi:MAG: hypothetical protein LUQ65_11265 [Candidatus Helarchaeota archaeon]|nr:hypothetical protein [Candidatus Helarchaeota archaeon]
MQAVKLEAEAEAFIGTSAIVQTTFNLPDNIKIFWAGSRIYAKRPCGRDIVISRADIFCEGQLEKGLYLREKTLPISNRVPPTVKERNLTYHIRSEINMIKPGTKSEEEFFFSDTPVLLKSMPVPISEAAPVSVSLKGIKINMAKDHFQPGETITLDYEIEKFKDLEVDLVKDANVTCYCPDYAPTCIHIKPTPPAIEQLVKASNLTAGSIQLTLLTFIELSHRFVWEPPEKTRWKETYGDYVNWVLEIIGTRISSEVVKFQIPIYIEAKPTVQDSTLFFSKQAKPPALQNILIPDMIQTLKPSQDGNRLTISLKNDSKNTLQGVTVKIVPIESEFFEMPPYLTGISEWKSTAVIQAFHHNVGKNVKTIQLLIEDNRGNAINKRVSL